MNEPIYKQLDWLCACSLTEPKPYRLGTLPAPIKDIVRGQELCDEALVFLSTCVPSTKVELLNPELFCEEDIDYHGNEGGVYEKICAHGFVVIGHESAEGDLYLLDLRDGKILLFPHECFQWDFLFEVRYDANLSRSSTKLPINHENVIRMAEKLFPDASDFLGDLKLGVVDSYTSFLWDIVQRGEGVETKVDAPDTREFDEKYLRLILSTPIDARTILDRHSKSLLDIARLRNNQWVVQILETYWANPGAFKSPSPN